MFPNSRSEQSDADDKKFNPFELVGNVCHYFHYSWEFATSGISYQNLVLLAASMPSYGKDDEKEEKKKVAEKMHNLFSGPVTKS